MSSISFVRASAFLKEGYGRAWYFCWRESFVKVLMLTLGIHLESCIAYNSVWSAITWVSSEFPKCSMPSVSAFKDCCTPITNCHWTNLNGNEDRYTTYFMESIRQMHQCWKGIVQDSASWFRIPLFFENALCVRVMSLRTGKPSPVSLAWIDCGEANL